MILESKGIINLTCYPRITVVEYKDAFRVFAFLELMPVETLADSNLHWKTITLATFDDELDAHYCLWHLYHSLQSGEKSWNPENIKMPSDAWQTTKKEFRSTGFHIKNVVKTAFLCLSGFYQWTIEYDPNIVARYKDFSSDDYAAVEKMLRDKLDSELTKEIQIEWTKGELLMLIAELENKAKSSMSEILNRVDPDNKLYSLESLTPEELYKIGTQLRIGLKGETRE